MASTKAADDGVFTFSHSFDTKRFRSLKHFGVFLASDWQESERQRAWNKSLREFGRTKAKKRQQLAAFLYDCTALYLKWLKERDPKRYGSVAMFERSDDSWKRYEAILIRILMSAGPMDRFKEVVKTAQVEFGKWEKKSKEHHKKLAAMAKDPSLVAEFKAYFEENCDEIDANAIWFEAAKAQNTAVVDFLVTESPPRSLQFWDCERRARVSPLTMGMPKAEEFEEKKEDAIDVSSSVPVVASTGVDASGQLDEFFMADMHMFDELEEIKTVANGQFTVLLSDGSEFSSLKTIATFVENASESVQKEMTAAWTKSLPQMEEATDSKNTQLGRFLFDLAELCLSNLKERNAERYGCLSMLEPTDSTWKHYMAIMTRLLMEAGPMDDLESVTKGIKQFAIWEDKAKKHTAKLLELAKGVSVSDEFKAYFDEHCDEVDVNALWKHIIAPTQSQLWLSADRCEPNVDAFRFLVTHSHLDVFKYWDCDAQSLVTPLSIAEEIKCSALVSCIDAYTGDSPATKLARRSAETDALALSTLKRLRKECGSDEAMERMMKWFARTICSQINDEVAFCPVFFAMTDIWQRSKTGASMSSVMAAFLKKSRNILDCKTVSKRSVQWKIAEDCLVDEDSCITAFLDEARAEDIADICSKTLLEESTQLTEDLRQCVEKHKDAYAELCDGSALKSTPESERPKWRQDSWFKDEGINQPTVAETELEDMSKPGFNAKALYDSNSYLNSLLTDAHCADSELRTFVAQLIKEHLALKCGEVQFGPVKGSKRCRAKALEDKKSKWPKTATLIDLTRFTFTFDTVKEMVAAILLFKDDICTQPMDEVKSDDTDTGETETGDVSGGKLTLELVRIKNGFSKLDGAALELPKGYCDVKLNVAIRVEVNGRRVGIIGEAQFLLRPTLVSKKANHQIYEVVRNASGLMTDARTALATQFSDPMDIVINAKTSAQLASVFFRFGDLPQFAKLAFVAKVLHIVALVSGLKPSLFEFVVRKYQRLDTDATHDKSDLFPGEFLQRLVAKRASDEKLVDCLREIRRLFGDALFDERLVQAEMGPMIAYIDHCPADLLSAEALRMLMPASFSETERVAFWNEKNERYNALFKAATVGNVAVIRLMHELGVDLDEGNENGATALYLAAKNGELDAIHALLELGADVSIPLKSGETPIWEAAYNGKSDAIRVLHEAGADISTYNKYGTTPLLAAALNGDMASIELLVEVGADVKAQNTNGLNAICCAAKEGHVDAIKLFHELGVDLKKQSKYGHDALFFAAVEGKVEAIRVLVELGADVNIRDGAGGAPLYIASKQGRVETVKFLHELGADVNTADGDGTTAVCAAAFCGHVKVIRLLHELGADLQKRAKDGRTAVFYAANNGHTEAIEVLYELGVDINIQRECDGWTPLCVTAFNGHISAMHALLKLGADCKKRDTDGRSAVYLAAGEGNVEAIKVLCKAGTDVNMPSANGCTPVWIAAHYGKVDAIRALHELGADLDKARTADGWTPVCMAAFKGEANAIRTLHELGADLKKLATDGSNAVHWAASKGSVEAIKVLHKAGVNLDIPDIDGRSAVYLAAQKGNVEAIKVLCKAGTDVNMPDTDGCTPVWIAAHYRKVDAIRTLRELGADLDKARTADGWTPVCEAAFMGEANVIRTLHELGADLKKLATDGSNAVHFAANNGCIEAIQVLYDAGVDIDIIAGANNGITAVFKAAWNGHVYAIRKLIELGADSKKLATDGRSTLHYAAQSGKVEAIHALCEAGLDVNLRDSGRNYTPTYFAAWQGHAGAIRALFKMGADLDIPNFEGTTPFIIAAANCRVHVIRALHELGANVNIRSADGRSAVYRAAQSGHVETISVLKELGLDLDAAMDDGRTPVCIGASEGKVEAIRVLQKLGADLKKRAKDGRTAVHFAAESGKVDTIRVLLQLGCELEATDESGKSALDWAKKGGHSGAVRFLEEAVGCEVPAKSPVTASAE